MSWQTDDEWDELGDFDGSPTTSLFGELRRDDSVTVTLGSDGEEVERDHGKAVRFEGCEIEDMSDGARVETWEDEPVEVGDTVVFETGSKAFLHKLKDLLDGDSPEGRTFEIIRNHTGPAPPEEYYTVIEQ